MNLHEIRMAGIRAAEDAVVRDLEKSGLAALTGAQPAPAAPSDTDAEHAAWLADKIVAHGDYAKEAAAMLRRWPGLCSAAPAAQPADSAMTTLQQCVAELVEQHGSLRAAARVLMVDAGYLSRLGSGEKDNPDDLLLRKMGLRRIVTFARARTLSAASNKERQHG